MYAGMEVENRRGQQKNIKAYSLRARGGGSSKPEARLYVDLNTCRYPGRCLGCQGDVVIQAEGPLFIASVSYTSDRENRLYIDYF